MNVHSPAAAAETVVDMEELQGVIAKGRDHGLLTEALRREKITRVLASLPRREREVLEMRYGIVGGRTRTLEEVGRAFNITRERVRR